jgi:nitrile hydratase
MTFARGDAVRVSTRPHEGHHRTPAYLKGRAGTVDRRHGAFRNPETRAYAGDGLPEQPLYLVRFRITHHDHVLADVFEHWLERAT